MILELASRERKVIVGVSSMDRETSLVYRNARNWEVEGTMYKVRRGPDMTSVVCRWTCNFIYRARLAELGFFCTLRVE
jgi:hypothetical protein